MKFFIILALASVALAYPITEHHSEDELPVPPMDDEDVKIARDMHLAEVARLTAEHLEALANAPKPIEEDEPQYIQYGVPTPTVVYHHAVEHQEDEIPVPPMDDEDVKIAREMHLAEVARLTAEHLEALANAPKPVEEDVPQYIKYAAPTPTVVYHHAVAHQEDEIPVAPMDDEDVKIAREMHLAEVARLTAEHLEALANAPKPVEDEPQYVQYSAPTVVYHHVVAHQEDELPVAPMDDEDVKVAREMHLAEVARLTAEHLEAVANAPKPVEDEPQYIQYSAPTVVYHHAVVHQEDELPVAPMDDEDVKIAREEHLAEVARLTAEHLEAVANAPKLIEEDEPRYVQYSAPTQVVFEPTYQYGAPQSDEVPVAPEQDDDVKIATAEHLAEVERIKYEHASAFADALRYAAP